MKICSLLPSGTEIACFLGLEKELVAVTHECDFPPSVRNLPRVVSSRFDHRTTAPGEIDRKVSAALRAGESLYRIHEEKIMDLRPELILTQNLCQVCAPSGVEASRFLTRLPWKPRILYLTSKTIPDILNDIVAVGEAAGIRAKAEERTGRLKAELAEIRKRTEGLRRRKMIYLEWLDPTYAAGHWLPEMAEIAGGTDPLGRPGEDSVRVPWEKILGEDPEVLIAGPCGYHLDDSEAAAREWIASRPGFGNLRAVKTGEFHAVDADAYFVRPGPRVVEGVKVLAEILHPETFKNAAPESSHRRILTAPPPVS
jgi:iron complex transport system substrate-binding protein